LYCDNRIPESGQFIEKENLFLTLLEVGKLKIKESAFGDGEGRNRRSNLNPETLP
jgi:hypothetical protein